VVDIRQRLADLQRSRLLATRTVHDLTPPPPAAYAAYGEGTWIVPPARVTTPSAISLGRGVTILEHAWLSVVAAIDGVQPSLRIGNNCSIGRMVHIACIGEVVIEDEVQTSDRVFIGDTYHDYSDPETPVRRQPMAYPRPVHIGRGTFLGIGSVVLQGVTIGEQAYIGAGAVVTADVPARTLVLGNPARPVRRYDDTQKEWVPV
jgi:acetyltransferase-like isoleucine patch superfamily enzyme